MATDKQQLGEFGERLLCKRSNCPRCKQSTTSGSERLTKPKEEKPWAKTKFVFSVWL